MARVLGVIPARYASTRFPGKPLAPLGGSTLLEQVWSRVRRARLERLIVATEDARIARAAERFGAEVMLTAADHASGTDRVAEVVERAGREYDVVLNVQGDEPLVTPASLERLAAALERGAAPLATLAEPLESADELFDPNVVKVVVARDGRALYFSRSPVPFYRGATPPRSADFRPALDRGAEGLFLKHQGIYAYTPAALLALARAAPTPLETAEGLEQLRALEAGLPLLVVRSDFHSIGVDTPADLERVARSLGAVGPPAPEPAPLTEEPGR